MLISKKIWDVMKDTKSLSISNSNSKIIFERILNDLLSFTKGQYGFIGEVLYQKDGKPYLKSKALTNIGWNDETQKLYESQYELGLEFHNLDTLFGEVLTSGESVIANDPINDPRAGGLPKGHPTMHSFLGVPIKFGGKLIGMVGLANKGGGYEKSDETKIASYLDSCATIIQSFREYEQRMKVEQELKVANEFLESTNRELENFASIASHDLQEPLRKIVTFGDLLTSRIPETDERSKEYLNRMQNTALRMRSLVEDLLQYTRVETKIRPFEVTDLNKVVQTIMEDLAVRLEESKGVVHINNLPTIEADPIQMYQLFLNLIGNALKFYREGVPPVVNLNSIKMENGFWGISVEDNGIGVEDEYVDKIFKPFERLHGQGAYEGTGIGLTICNKIVFRHGGKISVKKQSTRGVTFHIILPEKPNSAKLILSKSSIS
jgi:signal transduction histidine kinase